MPRQCTICAHDQRNEIDLELIGNESMRDVANRYRLNKSSVARHRLKCLPPHLVKAKEVQEISSASSLIERLMELNRETSEVLSQARLSKNWELALKAIARLEKQLELEARLLGELKDSGGSATVQIVVAYENAPHISPRGPLPVVVDAIVIDKEKAKDSIISEIRAID